MSYYYRMTTAQKESTDPTKIEGEPGCNLAGTEWILECTESGLECIVEYASSQDCVTYINNNGELWDEFYNL